MCQWVKEWLRFDSKHRLETQYTFTWGREIVLDSHCLYTHTEITEHITLTVTCTRIQLWDIPCIEKPFPATLMVYNGLSTRRPHDFAEAPPYMHPWILDLFIDTCTCVCVVLSWMAVWHGFHSRDVHSWHLKLAYQYTSRFPMYLNEHLCILCSGTRTWL